MLSFYAAGDVKIADTSLVARRPAGEPMRRAAFGLAQVILRELRQWTGSVKGCGVLLVVGSGDNGGDALWAGSFLRRRGVSVHAFLTDPQRVHVAGLTAFRRAGGAIITTVDEAETRATNCVLVDGVVGISGRGPLREPAARLFASKDGSTQKIIAVDVPSGVHPDTGVVDGPAVRADVTVAMGVRKPVHILAPRQCGRIEVVDVGYCEAGLARKPAELHGITPVVRCWQWAGASEYCAPGSAEGSIPVPGPGDDKYTQGVVGIVAGSPTYPGAGSLCVSGALAMTSGMVRAVGPEMSSLVAAYPELVVSDTLEKTGRVNAWVIGPGADESRIETMRTVLATDLPVVADASALRLVPELLRHRCAPTLITPHDREFAALRGEELHEDRVHAVKRFAKDWGITVLLKGNITTIATPEGHVWVNAAGNSWAATAGSGDVLAGMAGALLAAGRSPWITACMAADLHSRAAALAAGGPHGAPITASALARHISGAVKEVRGES